MTQPQNNDQPFSPELEEQMTLFGEGDHGDLLADEVPVYPPEPSGVIAQQYKDAYPQDI